MASRKSKKQRQREKNGVFRDFERNLISKGLPRGTKVGVQSNWQSQDVGGVARLHRTVYRRSSV